MNQFDSIWNFCTSRFHGTKDAIREFFFSRKLNQIEKDVDYHYNNLQSQNSSILKNILDEIYSRDMDIGNGDCTDIRFGRTRKQIYYLAAKWLICLIDVDRYYSERFDYALLRIYNSPDIFIHDEARPRYWFPNRPKNGHYMRARMKNEQK